MEAARAGRGPSQAGVPTVERHEEEPGQRPWFPMPQATAGSPPAEQRCFFDLAAGLAPAPGGPTLHVAIAGGERHVVFEGFREVPASHVMLLHARQDTHRAQRMRDAFCAAGIPTQLRRVDDDAFGGVLRGLTELVHEARLAYGCIAVNVGSGSPAAGCAAIAAAYLHGLRAFHVGEGGPCHLPVLPVGQRDLLHERDVGILRALSGSLRSLGALARLSALPGADVSARIMGGPGRKGLLALGLVERHHRPGLLPRFRLSATGRALLASGAMSDDGCNER